VHCHVASHKYKCGISTALLTPIMTSRALQPYTPYLISMFIILQIERLRKESSRLVEEEQEKLREQLKEEALRSFNDTDAGVRVRVGSITVTWRCRHWSQNYGDYVYSYFYTSSVVDILAPFFSEPNWTWPKLLCKTVFFSCPTFFLTAF